MQGYIESVDFDRRVISGWAYDPGGGNLASGLTIHIALDGAIVGSALPSGTRTDLRAKVAGADDLVFTAEVTMPFTADDLLSGRLTITAVSSRSLKQLKPTTAETLRIGQLAEAGSPTSFARASAAITTPETISHPRVAASQGSLTPIYLPVGMKSLDGTAQLGKRGHLFLTGGSNGLLDQYGPMASEKVSAVVEQWLSLFQRRQNLSQKRGILYVQTIVPEKLTVLKEHAPVQISGPTPLYSALEEAMAEQTSYVSGMVPFNNWQEEDDPFLKNDSHFSPAGARSAFVALLGKISPQLAELIRAIPMDHHVYGMGDLVNRFYGMPIYSRRAEPAAEQMAPYSRLLVQTEKYVPPRGHIGSRYSWENKSAMDSRRVLVFGNSFFGTGDRARELSWWGKHFFSEFYFIWDPKFDWKLIDTLRPDIIIGQTIERFLPQIPVE